MDEIQFRQRIIRERLAEHIELNEKPNWYSWFGFYPARSSVEASKAQLNAMDSDT